MNNLIKQLIYSKKINTFHSLLYFGNKIFKEYEEIQEREKEKDVFYLNTKRHPIYDYINLLIGKQKYKLLSHPLYYNHKIDRLDKILFFDTNIPITKDQKTTTELFKTIKKENFLGIIDLSKDIIIPNPWDATRLYKNIINMGTTQNNIDWKEDINNHHVNLYLPLGIAFSCNGHHSITAGVLKTEGVVNPKEIYDISPLYKHVYCDGMYYKRTYNNTTIRPVKNIEFAAIFEIGRIIVEKGITYKFR